MGFSDLAGFDRSLGETAQVIATPEARQRLEDYRGYLRQVTRGLDARFAALPADRRPRVLHLESWSPLRADGSDTMIDQWIRLAGGRNAAQGLKGNRQPVSLEQIARWNPDIIIVGGLAQGPDDQPWSREPLLRGKRIVRNPVGVFPWDRYGPEFALQLQWAAGVLHPQPGASPDMVAETRAFYQRFFGYRLSQDQARLILSGRRPDA
jgi:iron complex transport system substrate-binding protein